tara:strand:- start:784 stop:948 length:165 start_codon:yes stop_codon:yes gene_type:complete
MKYQATKLFYSLITGSMPAGRQIELSEKTAQPLVRDGYLVSLEPKKKKATKKAK